MFDARQISSTKEYESLVIETPFVCAIFLTAEAIAADACRYRLGGASSSGYVSRIRIEFFLAVSTLAAIL
jgi:hypothetical protein